MRRKSNHFVASQYIFIQNRICQQNITRLSYRVFHSSPPFAQTFSFLPAHLLQHLPSFIDFTDLPLRIQIRHPSYVIRYFPSLAVTVKDNMLTDEQKQVHHLVGKHPRCQPSVVETLLGPCIWGSSGLWPPRIHCSVYRKAQR